MTDGGEILRNVLTRQNQTRAPRFYGLRNGPLTIAANAGIGATAYANIQFDQGKTFLITGIVATLLLYAEVGGVLTARAADLVTLDFIKVRNKRRLYRAPALANTVTSQSFNGNEIGSVYLPFVGDDSIQVEMVKLANVADREYRLDLTLGGIEYV